MGAMESYLPLWGFMTLMVATPGPANLLLMSAGARHGYAKLLPFTLGLVGGKLLLNIAISLGLATLLFNYPIAVNALALFSAVYMVFLAMQGWNPPKTAANPTRFFGFSYGLIIHPLSPKTWTMTTLAFTQFSAHYTTTFGKYILVPLSFLILQFIFHSLWCVAGALLQKTLTSNLLLQRALILLTIATILWALLR